MLTTYKNPWVKKGLGPIEYATDAAPEEYKGYLIYCRPDATTGIPVWDVVLGGVCVTQRAGINGAKRAIDAFEEGVA